MPRRRPWPATRELAQVARRRRLVVFPAVLREGQRAPRIGASRRPGDGLHERRPRQALSVERRLARLRPLRGRGVSPVHARPGVVPGAGRHASRNAARRWRALRALAAAVWLGLLVARASDSPAGLLALACLAESSPRSPPGLGAMRSRPSSPPRGAGPDRRALERARHARIRAGALVDPARRRSSMGESGEPLATLARRRRRARARLRCPAYCDAEWCDRVEGLRA